AANPKSLLFVPLKIENEIFGIIELGAFRELQDYEIAFTESVSKSIAATISNMRINERTNQLLEQTQTMAEELALNHEESLMKQAELEELKKQIERLSKL
ncbi:MAG TPA: histidine kinase, partial [Bacteroidales bacterium]|nr:histidine kinase [Bacteroidales bacterium]